MKLLDVTSLEIGTPVPFRVVLLAAGETPPVYPSARSTEHALVEFYDRRYAHSAHGQFVSRYWLDTMLTTTPGAGMDLDGGVPSWSLDGQAMDVVRAWLRSHAATEPRAFPVRDADDLADARALLNR